MYKKMRNIINLENPLYICVAACFDGGLKVKSKVHTYYVMQVSAINTIDSHI